ncbi:TIGR04104 family putative zinc finger protein [Planomicrobium sp. CPCC 101079]|uniref:TIGR04104 family putative zinc finger protein n=1 Tax=Planomicrobium sp. CPCC 101079 TaxID=2599618 RepID=UPI0016474309
MPTCQNCGHQWSWKTTFKKTLKINNGMICPFCGARQFATAKSRMRVGSLCSIIAPLLILSSYFLHLSAKELIAIGLPLTIAIILASPFLYELSNDEKPLW